MCLLYNTCRTANLSSVLGPLLLLNLDQCSLSIPVFVQHSELVHVVRQDDCLGSRMKNSAKMLPHLFTQTNENRRLNTQYRCHFRINLFYVVGSDSACSRVALRRLGPGCRHR